MLENKILQYDRCVGDRDYLIAIASSTDWQLLSNSICQLLRSPDFNIFDITCLFLRDYILFCPEELIENYPESSIVATLEELLFSNNHFVRRQVIYTLGKTCSYSSVAAMTEAFYQWQDRDPILLPRAIGELLWLGCDRIFDLITSMTNSQFYLTRWAAIESLSDFHYDAKKQDAIFQYKCDCFKQLTQDINDLVRAWAEFEYAMLMFRAEAHLLEKSERSRQQKDLMRSQPRLHFDNIKTEFENYLYTNAIDCYSINDMEAFVEKQLTSRGRTRKVK